MFDLEFSLFLVHNDVGRSHCGIVIACVPPTHSNSTCMHEVM